MELKLENATVTRREAGTARKRQPREVGWYPGRLKVFDCSNACVQWNTYGAFATSQNGRRRARQMGSGDDAQDAQIAGAALAVALVALAIAVTQLCGQLFATADGYRRCQPSVMGAWAQYTRLRWKWSEMRFETLFTTPEISLQECNFESEIDRMGREANSWPKLAPIKYVSDFPKPGAFNHFSAEVVDKWRYEKLLDAKLVDSNIGTGSYHEMACWIPFLRSIREFELLFFSRSNPEYHKIAISRVVCRPIQKSWDFMSPELVRPLAVTYVGDIAIIVQRLGMEWQTFRPEEGEMRAEGQGQIIYSTLVRSVGPVLHYAHATTTDQPYSSFKSMNRMLSIPEADELRFGILPQSRLMLTGGPALKLGTIREIEATLDSLDPTGSASKKVRDNRRFDNTSTWGVSDLIPMAIDMLREQGGYRHWLPAPTEHYAGLTTHREGLVVFRHRLGDYVAQNRGDCSHARWILDMYDSFKALDSSWEYGIDDGDLLLLTNRSLLDRVHDAWVHTDKFFHGFHSRPGLPAWFYTKLVGCHIKHAVNYWHEAHQKIENKEIREHHGLTNWLAEGMHLYWDYLPDIVNEMSLTVKKELYSWNGEEMCDSLISQAWIMLMFRAFCWSRCHYMGPEHGRSPESSRIPSRYWKSKLPVWLG
ncbi:MAG: hypothetical protein LQ352_007412 [Teloschistes flavicans]|nr:MAG: hypothetical protein LQ352_007412 [Teloschistes flavicans]